MLNAQQKMGRYRVGWQPIVWTVCCWGICLGFCSAVSAETLDFSQDVKPILTKHCTECHGAETQESGLRLDVGAGLLEGGYSGPSIIRGKSDESLLVKAILGHDEEISQMPPEGPGPTAQQVATLKNWIDAGAPIPEEGGLNTTRKSSEHWSFQAVRNPTPPEVNNASAVKNPIDAFVVSRLEQHGLSPSAEADKTTLIRRLSLDLLGLPPTIAEVDDFINDTSEDAYVKLVDRLLESPHYGERWARHWLDVARFAESNGYTIDRARSVWKYRDWVIQAIQQDMPFDQFVIEQLAGDLLPKANTSQVIATGFHRNTMVNDEGGTDDEQFRVEAIVDRVATTGAAFLGLTLGCARCHDHKYDPVSQREFYQLFAIFNNADEPTLPLPTPEQTKQLAEKQKQIRETEELLAEFDALSTEFKQPWEEKQKSVTAAHKQVKQAIPTTLVMRERKQPRNTYIHLRGDFLRHGTKVSPGVPGVLPPIETRGESSDRLDFARWLVSREHPLTARVTVNRVWQRYFGKGLVATENDFGVQGDLPTHPELLDWLATRFMEQGWSMKKLHRLIVTSATYRQASHTREDLQKADPYNKLLGQQQRLRLEAESIRDVALAASGLLTRKVGGPSVYPPQPEGVYRFTQVKQTWNSSEGTDRFRRGMYTYLWRSSPYPFLKTFDAPDATVTCTRRPRSNTPLQALTLANDVAFFEIAQGFARSLLTEASEDAQERIRFAFRRCLARYPTDEELENLQAYLEIQREHYQQHPEQAQALCSEEELEGTETADMAAWTLLARVLLNLDEFITRE